MYYYRIELVCYFTNGPATHSHLYVNYSVPFNELLQEALIEHHQLSIVPELLEHLVSIVVSSIEFLGAHYDSPLVEYQPRGIAFNNFTSNYGISVQWLPEPYSWI